MIGGQNFNNGNKMLSNTGGFGAMMTQGQSMHHNVMTGSGQQNNMNSTSQNQQIRGYSPSKPKWKQNGQM